MAGLARGTCIRSRSRTVRSYGAPALGFVLALAALLAGASRAEAQFDMVRFDGIVGEPSARIGGMRLDLDGKSIPFGVTAVQRISPPPVEGVSILKAMGPGTPEVHVVGSAPLVAKIKDAKKGTELELTGQLDLVLRVYQLLSVQEPAPDS